MPAPDDSAMQHDVDLAKKHPANSTKDAKR